MSTETNELTDKCKKSVEHFKKEAGRLRTGRASASILEGLMVDYYGSMVPLQSLGTVNVPEPRQIMVQVYDRAAVEAIDKAIQGANLGLNPSRDGSIVRINIPPLTEERRRDLVKQLHKMGEEAKVGIRNNRRDVLEILKKKEKAKELSTDDHRRSQEEVQKVTDKYTAEIDGVVTSKEKEMMEV